MASVFTPFENYRTGSSMSFPIVKAFPLNMGNWEPFQIRVKVKTASELFIGAACEQADSGTWGIVEKTSDKSLKVLGIVTDCLENKTQLEIDNSGAKCTKALFFAANSYIWILPLIPGTIFSIRLQASVAATDEGNYICTTSTGDFRTLAAIATDVDQQAKIMRNIGGMNTNGTGVQYTCAVVV